MAKNNSPKMLYPYSVRVGRNSVLYATDTYNHRIKRINDGKMESFLVGIEGKMIKFPSDISFSGNGDVFIVDSDFSQVVYKDNKSGLLKKLQPSDGKKTFSLAYPTQSDILDNVLYISDTMNNRIIGVDLENHELVLEFEAHRPLGLAVNRKTKELHFTQRGRAGVFVWRDGKTQPFAGCSILGFADGQSTAAFFDPYGLSAQEDGAIIVADMGNHAVRSVDLEGYVTTLAGKRTAGSDDGANATFRYPMGVSASPDGSVYVADTYNHSVRKIWPDLSVTTIA